MYRRLGQKTMVEKATEGRKAKERERRMQKLGPKPTLKPKISHRPATPGRRSNRPGSLATHPVYPDEFGSEKHSTNSNPPCPSAGNRPATPPEPRFPTWRPTIPYLAISAKNQELLSNDDAVINDELLPAAND